MVCPFQGLKNGGLSVICHKKVLNLVWEIYNFFLDVLRLCHKPSVAELSQLIATNEGGRGGGQFIGLDSYRSLNLFNLYSALELSNWS